ncbi:MAG TPA: IS1380 family transposase [Candidatus Binatia bacterium]|nr:IS1380 family transposase [Candidatus Binatia bacterium]
MPYSTPEQLRFPPLPGYTVRADFDGGALSSDFGALILRGIDRQIGFTARLAAAVRDKRHPSYTDHPLRDLCAQRIYQIASGYADGNDANSLRHDPLFKLSVERVPLDPTQALASAPTFSRLEHSVTRPDLYRLTQAFVDHFIASYPEPPAAVVFDLDHSEDPTHGQQELTFYNHHYQSYCYLPLFIFEGTSHALVTACLRPGKRPPGTENAMILVRLLAYLRRHWPSTHILVRGDSHFATPEVMDVIAHRRLTDFVFGLAGNPVLLRQAAPVMQEARNLLQQRTALAHAYGEQPPSSSRVYEDFPYAAASWAQPWRVIVKAEVMAAGDNPRFVVTSLEAPPPPQVYEDLYCARGNCENDIKAVKNDLHSDRTSATTFLANATRLLLSCAAYVLHHALRTYTLAHTALATAQPSTVILTLFKVATQVKQYKDRILLHLPTSCPVKALLHRVTMLLTAIPVPALNTS